MQMECLLFSLVKITCSQKEQVSAYAFALLLASDSLLASEYRFERQATIGMFIFFTSEKYERGEKYNHVKTKKKTLRWSLLSNYFWLCSRA